METSVASIKAFDTVVRFFQDDDWKFTRREDKQILHMSCGCKNGHYVCLAHIVEEQPVVRFMAIAGFRVPEEKRQAMAEFLTRANYGLCVGNFEMDFTDGEVRYKTSLDLRDGELTIDMVRALVHANLSTMDRYLPGMMSILWSDISPEAAVRKIEADFRRPFPWESDRLRRTG